MRHSVDDWPAPSAPPCVALLWSVCAPPCSLAPQGDVFHTGDVRQLVQSRGLPSHSACGPRGRREVHACGSALSPSQVTAYTRGARRSNDERDEKSDAHGLKRNEAHAAMESNPLMPFKQAAPAQPQSESPASAGRALPRVSRRRACCASRCLRSCTVDTTGSASSSEKGRRSDLGGLLRRLSLCVWVCTQKQKT
jgi:hypothetical protein